VRLSNGDDSALRTFTRSRQHRADFDGVVAIIVDDRNDPTVKGNFANLAKAALNATEFVKAVRNICVAHPHFKANGDRSQRVLDIVAPRRGLGEEGAAEDDDESHESYQLEMEDFKGADGNQDGNVDFEVSHNYVCRHT
jgi:hypothetical protein